MKKWTVLVVFVLIAVSGSAQEGEFKTYDNGLIYSEKTMSKLRSIADSLNLKFKQCNFDQEFYSRYQTIGHVVKLDAKDIKEAKKDLDRNMGFEAFLAKYPDAKVERGALFLKSIGKNRTDEDVLEFTHFKLTGEYNFNITVADRALFKSDFKDRWVYEHQSKTSYSEEKLTAFYFPEAFVSKPLPSRYAQMIGYADCLIDTTTTKLKDIQKEGWVALPKDWTSLPPKKMEQLLEEMRSTSVIGFCSMDSRPRTHAVNIALVSAEANKWEVFLKAHLDIMNDRFERMSDGSYAWANRKTYIKELEELNINVLDLIFGISLRMENPAAKHYFGSISRVGRALSETANRNEVEDAMLSVVMDTELDYFNRVIFYFLFKNYEYHLEDDEAEEERSAKLRAALATLPAFIGVKLQKGQ